MLHKSQMSHIPRHPLPPSRKFGLLRNHLIDPIAPIAPDGLRRDVGYGTFGTCEAFQNTPLPPFDFLNT